MQFFEDRLCGDWKKMQARLTTRFIAEVEPLLATGDVPTLTAVLADWETRLSCIKKKTGCFNPYDIVDSINLFERHKTSGEGWSAQHS